LKKHQQHRAVEIQREQTANTTTEIRREVKKPEPAQSEPAPAAETNSSTEQPAKPAATPAAPKNNSSSANKSEDDAVADAIAAAMPALEN
jgi:hypothetical protein